MFKAISNQIKKKQLKDKDYCFLFDTPPEDEYIAFDTETTGLDPKKAHILSIGAVKIVKNKVLTSKSLHLYIRQDEWVEESSIRIHYIRNKDLVHGIETDDAVKEFLHFIGSRPLVGYYIDFDVAMINNWTKENIGITLPNKRIEVSQVYLKKMHNTAIHQTDLDLSFDTIMRKLKLPVLGKHDALNDAVMTALMFITLKNRKVVV